MYSNRMRSLGSGLFLAIATVFFSPTVQANDFAPGDLYLLGLDGATGNRYVVRIDPDSGAQTELFSTNVALMDDLSYDPFRDRLIIREQLGGHSLISIDAFGNTENINFGVGTLLYGSAQLWTPACEGRIYIASLMGYIGYVDPGEEIGHPLLNNAADAPFHLSFTPQGSQMIYHAGTNSLIFVRATGVATRFTVIHLSGDGTHVDGPVDQFDIDLSGSGGEVIVGLSAGPDGKLFIQLNLGVPLSDGLPRMHLLDPVALTSTPFNYIDTSADNITGVGPRLPAGTYNSVLETAVTVSQSPGTDPQTNLLLSDQNPSILQWFTLLNPVDVPGHAIRLISIGDTISGNCADGGPVDSDGDGVPDDTDNCPDIPNDQTDSDGDGFGDECDLCPNDPEDDVDGDGFCADEDNCSTTLNPDQLDSDSDGLGDACDLCPNDPEDDVDGDGWCSDVDNCPNTFNEFQTDFDSDGIGDTCDDDDDNDGLLDVDEVSFGTDPLNSDSDNDGLSDGEEIYMYFTDPNDADTDDDGLSDGFEIDIAEFGCPNPLLADSDGDGMSDWAELEAMLDPCDEDFDNDGLTDGNEILFGTDPTNPDTDGDGLNDGTEVDMAFEAGTDCPNPLVSDSDGDGLTDGEEVNDVMSNPCDVDSDNDGIPDADDPYPTVSDVIMELAEEVAMETAIAVDELSLGVVIAPNNNAARGRQNSLANRMRNVAKKIANGDFQNAIDLLLGILARMDGQEPPADWLEPSAATDAIVAEIELLIFLLELEL